MQTPASKKSQKWPFFLGDAVLIGAAIFIGAYSDTPLSFGAAAAIFLCCSIGAALAAAPFILEQNNTRREIDGHFQAQHDLHTQRLAQIAEAQLSAISQIKSTHEVAQAAAQAINDLPSDLRTHTDELLAELTAAGKEAKDALTKKLSAARETENAKLTALSEKLESASSSLAALEKNFSLTHQKILAAQETTEAKLKSLQAIGEARPAPPAAPLVEATTSAPKPSPKKPIEKASTPAASTVSILGTSREVVTIEPPTPAPTSESNIPREISAAPALRATPTRSEPKAKSSEKSESLFLSLENTITLEPELEDAPTADRLSAPPARTSDGSTRLLVTAYIGIGNRIFVRGDGPGLSWEKGVPMEFVSIGKWSWQTPDALSAFTVQFYKNDDTAATSEPVRISPGHHVEASPIFRDADPF